MAPIWARAIWFVFVGWWLGLIWMGISLLLMVTIILFPMGAYMISKTWEIMTLNSSPARVIEEGQQRTGTNSSQSGTGKKSAQSKEFFKIAPTEFAYVEFDAVNDAKLEYTIEVHNGPPINTIVTFESYMEEFRKSTNIKWVENASALNVENTQKEAVIKPADYVLILDNTGRIGEQKASGEAEVTLEYRVIE